MELPPLAAAGAVQMEEAVERAEEKRQQSPSPPPSPGNGMPRRRSICLLVPWDNEPLVLPPGPDPGYPITAEIIEEERKAAQQRLCRLLGQKFIQPCLLDAGKIQDPGNSQAAKGRHPSFPSVNGSAAGPPAAGLLVQSSPKAGPQ
ncbi:nuclear envelope pore membrane protein POM 121-like [Melopsittacus undulatus]|uniref:nuclear envelope pore membrane protein POM 121-like n=1 Tax=Melopsittacus undulatus TaxID=13146 RepID=UPI00146B01D2|nr:nuclear envelope pore membrane protein POM 121-like [Melopsittacus undulatus]